MKGEPVWQAPVKAVLPQCVEVSRKSEASVRTSRVASEHHVLAVSLHYKLLGRTCGSKPVSMRYCHPASVSIRDAGNADASSRDLR